MSMRSRRLERYRLISIDEGRSGTLSAHKIGGPRASARWCWPRTCRGWSRCCAAAVRNSAPGRHRECRGHCGLRSRRQGRHGRLEGCRTAAGPAEPP
jgi:hypothetical protein